MRKHIANNYRVTASLAALSVAVCVLGASAPTGTPTATTSLVMVGRSPAFYALVDGHQALLELDTGSFELRLSPKFVQENKLDPNSVQLQIGGSPQENLKPVIEEISEPDRPTLADTFTAHSDGIVGLDVLRKYAVGIDEQNQKVVFWLGGNMGTHLADQWTIITDERKPAAMVALNLTTRSDEDWYRIQTGVNGKLLNLIFDTGTAFSTVNPSVATSLHLKTVGQTEVEEIGHSETLRIVQADSLTFGPLKASFPVLNIESEDSRDSDGILGTEALGQGKFLIDMPGSKLYVRQFARFRDHNPLELRLRRAGLDFFPDDQNNLVVLVSPGSKADKAGIKTGDRLVAFGKVSVTQLVGLFNGSMERDTKDNVLALGLELLKKNLTVTVQADQGSKIVLVLPPSA